MGKGGSVISSRSGWRESLNSGAIDELTLYCRVAAGVKGINSGSSVVWLTERTAGRRQGSRVAYQAPSAVVETSSVVAGVVGMRSRRARVAWTTSTRLILPDGIVGCGAGRQAQSFFLFVLIGPNLSGCLVTSHTL